MMRWLALLALLFAVEAQAALLPFKVTVQNDWAATFGPCTYGTDCYCDQILGDGLGPATGTNYGAASIYFCFDGDNPILTATTGSGNWVDQPYADNRGGSSWWATNWGNGVNGALWKNGEPTTPTYGATCDVSGVPATYCTGTKVWTSDDRWDANAHEPWIAVFEANSDFSSENGSSVPLIPGGGGTAVFGNATFAERNPRNTERISDRTGGLTTSFDLIPGSHEQVGATFAMAIEATASTSGILSQPWKMMEFQGVGDSQVNEGLLGFRQTSASTPSDTFPIQGFFFTPTTSCASMIAGATQTLGSVYCDGSDNLIWYAEESAYSFASQWSFTSHHCLSPYWDFRNPSNVTVKYWFNGTLVLDISGLDFTGSYYDGGAGTNGVSNMAFDNYSNYAEYVGALGASVWRSWDNLTIRDGTPVLCEDIGFPSSYNQSGL